MIIQDENFDFLEIQDSEINNLINKKFVVALDFDGVITSPHSLKAKYINDLGYNLSPNQADKEICINLGVKKEDYSKGSIKAYTEDPAKLPVENLFFENFNNINLMPNVKTFIISSRYGAMMQHLHDFLKFYKIKVSGIINVNGGNKITGLRKINPEIFIEDSLEKIENVLKELKTTEPLSKCIFVFYRNIGNSLVQNKNNILERDNWNDIYQLVKNKNAHL